MLDVAVFPSVKLKNNTNVLIKKVSPKLVPSFLIIITCCQINFNYWQPSSECARHRGLGSGLSGMMQLA